MVLALLQLRRPKLSEHLDPAALSSILSSALPPVDAAQIQELAEGFERLDQQRAHLLGLDDEVKAARALLDRARSYGRAVLRERARAVTGAATRFDATSRDLRLGAARFESTRSAASEARRAYLAAQRELSELTGDRETLARSEDYRNGQQLEELRRRVHDAEQKAGVTEHDARQEEARAARSAEEARTHEATAAAARAERARHVDAPGDLRARLAAREDQVAEIGRLVEAHDDAVADRLRRDEQLAQATDAVEEGQRLLAEAERALDLAVEQFAAAVDSWAASCAELEPTTTDVRLAVRDERVTGYVAALLREHVAGLAAERALLRKQRDDAIARRDELVAERDALATEGPVSPSAPRFRTAERDGRPGAPLWQVVDFRDGVSDDEQAALEAALEASGLLDAWVSPTGELWVDGHDMLVGPGARVDEPTLADALNVDVAAGGRADSVGRVLAGIGLGPSDATSWVALDGRWRARCRVRLVVEAVGAVRGCGRARAEPPGAPRHARGAARRRRPGGRRP